MLSFVMFLVYSAAIFDFVFTKLTTTSRTSFHYIQAAICCSLCTINQIPPSLLLISSACFLDAHLILFIACNSPRIGNTNVSSCTVIALKSRKHR